MNKTGTYDQPPSLKASRVHEFSGPSAAAFAFLMARNGQTILCGAPSWVLSLHPEGLARFCNPNSVLLIASPLDTDVLWAAETALRSEAAKNVVSVTEKSPGLTNFRRLQLAALAGKSLGLVIVNRPAHSTAAETRWHCAPAYTDQEKGICIHASLYKNKKGIVGSWNINVVWEADIVHLDAAPAGEPVWPGRITD